MNKINTIRDQVSRVQKMKETKQRNRDIKQNEDLKIQLKELQIAQMKVIIETKQLQKEKAAFKQKEEKYNF